MQLRKSLCQLSSQLNSFLTSNFQHLSYDARRASVGRLGGGVQQLEGPQGARCLATQISYWAALQALNFEPHNKIWTVHASLLYLCRHLQCTKLAVARSALRPVSLTGDYSMELTGPFWRLQTSLQLHVLPDIYGDISCNTIGSQWFREVTPIFYD